MNKVIDNVLRGFSSIAGVHPTTHMPLIKVNELSVEQALREDWMKIGMDIKTAMKKFEDGEKKAY